ncbi:dihydrofolate reductase [Sediminihabitans luteus]|uniref:Dihydrofolate reductase n=1 Tax=Sediminihabitans luteus TaxID=1138585 RepID=A0A2M9CZH1_9CELL|nr:dihydrofolate reductase family protein [Sediminihabitans luteus]PJJ77138.1 dihydrofolate reductase [Sediminihabitans luteus]GII98586.1 pyrimidine reductase [Sediminihabitans luteus]
MARLSATLFMSLDGVVEVEAQDPTQWHFPFFDEPMGAAVAATHAPGTMLFGRVTYDSFAGAWPAREAAGEEDAEFAAELGDKRKIVVSRSPLTFTWRNSEQAEGDLLDVADALRAGDDDAFLTGSPSVVRQLIVAGRLDELHVFVHPALLGRGTRLFPDDGELRLLRLVSSETFPRGVVHLVYAPAT